MIIDFDEIEIYIKPGVTDMRKQINGLSITGSGGNESGFIFLLNISIQ